MHSVRPKCSGKAGIQKSDHLPRRAKGRAEGEQFSAVTARKRIKVPREIPNFCAASVDRLLGVANHTEVPLTRSGSSALRPRTEDRAFRSRNLHQDGELL